jgi:hypothetical protein
LLADDINLTFTGTGVTSGGLQVLGTGSIGKYSLSNISMVNGRGLLGFEDAASTIGPGRIVNAVLKTPDRIGNIHVAVLDLTLTNVMLDTPASPSFFVSGTPATALTLRGSGITAVGGWTGFQLGSGSPIVHVQIPDYPVNVTQLTPGNGDKAYNTTGGSCGVGPIISNGSTFKNLFTGTGC